MNKIFKKLINKIKIKREKTLYSKNMELKISDWLNKHNDLEIKKIVDTIFDILEKCEIKKLSELSNVKIYLPENYISKGIVSFNIDGYTSDEIGEILGNDYNTED